MTLVFALPSLAVWLLKICSLHLIKAEMGMMVVLPSQGREDPRRKCSDRDLFSLSYPIHLRGKSWLRRDAVVLLRRQFIGGPRGYLFS